MTSMIGCTNVGFFRIIGFRHPFSHCRRLFASAPLCSSLQYPDVPALADSAHISLSPKEVEDFAPKIRQVVDWFGQLQAIDLECYQPSFRADTEVDPVLSEDSAIIFENREAILAEVPSYDKPYIKVPKVINKEFQAYFDGKSDFSANFPYICKDVSQQENNKHRSIGMHLSHLRGLCNYPLLILKFACEDGMIRIRYSYDLKPHICACIKLISAR